MTLSVTMVQSCFLLVAPTDGARAAVLSITGAPARARTNPATAVAPRLDSLRMKVGRFDSGGYDRPGQRRQGPVGPRRRMIAGEVARRKRYTPARETLHARETRAGIRTRRGRRDRLAHRLDLLRAKGFWPPWRRSWPTAFVVHGDLATLDFGGRFTAIVALAFFRADARGERSLPHSVSLATETFAPRATTSNGSPAQTRHHRHLALDRIALRSCIDAEGACASYGGALRFPSGFSPASIVISKPPVAVDPRSQMSQLTVTHPFHCADRHNALLVNRREPSRTPIHCKARTRRLASGTFVTLGRCVVCVLGKVEDARRRPRTRPAIKRIRGLARDLKSSPPHSRCRSRRGSALPTSQSPRAIRARLPNASSRLDARSVFRCHLS